MEELVMKEEEARSGCGCGGVMGSGIKGSVKEERIMGRVSALSLNYWTMLHTLLALVEAEYIEQ